MEAQAPTFAAYDAAMDAGDYAAALSIAYASPEDFDWSGEVPDDWSDDDIRAAVELGVIR